MCLIIGAAFGPDGVALRIGRRLRKCRHCDSEYHGCRRREERRGPAQHLDHLKKSLALSRWSRRFSRSEMFSGADKKSSRAGSFSLSGFTASELLLFIGGGKRFSEKPSPKQNQLGHGNEAYAFANLHQVEWQREAESRRRLPRCSRLIGVRYFNCMRTE